MSKTEHSSDQGGDRGGGHHDPGRSLKMYLRFAAMILTGMVVISVAWAVLSHGKLH